MMLRRFRDAPTTVVLIHSSDEMYGSDRMVLQVIDSMPSRLRERLTVVLPLNADGPGELTHALRRLDIVVRHRRLPVLRRRSLTSPVALLLLVWRTLTLAWWLRRARAGTVYSMTSATALAVVAARGAGVRQSIAHVQEVWQGPEAKVLGIPVASAHCVIATSSAVRAALPARLRTRALVVENGIAAPDRLQMPRKADGPPRFLVASRWSPRKGYETLLGAWDALDTPPGILVIAGSAPALGNGVDVRGMVARLTYPESVEIVGQVDSIFDLLDDVDAVIVPSDEPEAFGLVAIEAFSRSRAAIASDGGGLAEIVDHGVNGLLFEPTNASALRVSLLGLDRETLRQMGEQGRQKFCERYSADAFAERMALVWELMGE